MNTWLKGLGVAVLSAVITGLLGMGLAPDTFNFTKAGMLKLLALILPIALKAVLLYLKQSPLPGGSQPPSPITQMGNSGRIASMILVCLLLSAAMHAQAPPSQPAPPPIPSPTPALPQNIYAGGISYNSGASPEIAGTGLYAHLLSDGTGTYAFTVVDALPISVRPFTVNTNFGAGVAQKVLTLGKVPIFIPTSAGVSYNGTNTGWSWSTGAMASIKVGKAGWRVFPNVRIQKSSVSNGAGYMPVVGVLFGWGQ